MNRAKSVNRRTWLSSPYIIWVIGFTVIPLGVIFKYALTSREGGGSLENIVAIFDPIHLKAMVFSLEIAIGCTLICILLSYPLVLALRYLGMGRQGFTMFILILPMWMNFILRILAWQMILSNNGILNFLLTRLGMDALPLANTGTAIMGWCMMIFPTWCFPFLTQWRRSTKTSLRRRGIWGPMALPYSGRSYFRCPYRGYSAGS